MKILRLLPVPIFLCLCVPFAGAQDSAGYQRELAKMAPELRHLDFVWAAATGDLNGDGIPDVAMLLTGSRRDDQPREERLVVLAGRPDGGYKILAISGEFCHPGKFYNLDIRKLSLFVEAVESADAASKSSYTLQFRHNARLNDFELIGREVRSEGYEDGSEDRISSNYLTGESIRTTKEGGRTRTTKKRIARPGHAVLNGSACDAFPD